MLMSQIEIISETELLNISNQNYEQIRLHKYGKIAIITLIIQNVLILHHLKSINKYTKINDIIYCI